MATQIQEDAKKLQAEVFEQDYYIHLYMAALKQHNMSVASIDQFEHSDKDLVNMANSFWFALPDSSAIRRQPFYLLCDIAEHCFDEEPGE